MTQKRKGRVGPRPTDGELQILRVLWERGPSTVRQIHDTMVAAARPGPGYTTVLKLMQIMTAKGLLDRDERQRPQVYTSRFAQHETQRQLLRDLLDRAFGGSHRALVLQALADRKASDDELLEIEGLLDRIEGESR